MGKYSKKQKSYSQQQILDVANSIIRRETTTRKAAEKHGIGRQVLRNKIDELQGKRHITVQGRSRVLTRQQEAEMTKVIRDMSDIGFAPTPKQVLSIAIEYAEVNEIPNPRFNASVSPSKRLLTNRIWRPTRKWLGIFMKRNNLSRKKTKGMHIGRFRNIRNPFLINNFYDLLDQQLQRLNLVNRPECIWNLDESGFPTDPNNVETVSMKGQKVVKVVGGTGRQNITVLAACNAAGESMPPLIVFSSKAAVLNSIPPEWAGDEGVALPGTWYGLSKNGWMTTIVFEDWFAKFCEKTKKNRPILLLLDGHLSHLSSETRRKANLENVTIIKLPSHTTSKLQPLDIAVFGPLKYYWAEQMNNWIMSMGIPIRSMTKKQFVNNLSLIWMKGLSEDNIKAGFRSVGIYPFNSEKYDRSIFDPELLVKYNRWVQLGKPTDMEEENDPAEENVQVDPVTPEHPQPPAPLDEHGNPRRGKWVWIDEDQAELVSPSGCSFVDIVVGRMNQTPSTATGKCRKRIDMNSAVITQPEIDVALEDQPLVCASTSSTAPKPVSTVKRGKPIANSSKLPQDKCKKKKVEENSDEDEEVEDESDDEMELLDEDDLEDEEGEETDEDESLQNSQTLKSQLNIQDTLNMEDWEDKMGQKLFAVHFDKPRKFYIGRLKKVFRRDEDQLVNEVSFHFLDFRGEGRYVVKPNAQFEVVPVGNIFYGPIDSSAVPGNAVLIQHATVNDIQRAWAKFCSDHI